MKPNKILATLWDYFLISVGTLIFCLAWTSFIQPNGLTSGGLTGLCTIIQYATNGAIPIGLTYPIINGGLLVLGFLCLGASFGFKTIYVIALSSILFSVLPNFDGEVWSLNLKVLMNNKLLVNFDCVSDGENILLVLNKKARGYAKQLEEAFKANESVKVEIATKGVFYPSDQASFPYGVGVAALNYSKALRTYYMDKIHTDKDRVYREENIEFLVESSVKLASILSSKQ